MCLLSQSVGYGDFKLSIKCMEIFRIFLYYLMSWEAEAPSEITSSTSTCSRPGNVVSKAVLWELFTMALEHWCASD